jgi:hypothetical protein
MIYRMDIQRAVTHAAKSQSPEAARCAGELLQSMDCRRGFHLEGIDQKTLNQWAKEWASMIAESTR